MSDRDPKALAVERAFRGTPETGGEFAAQRAGVRPEDFQTFGEYQAACFAVPGFQILFDDRVDQSMRAAWELAHR